LSDRHHSEAREAALTIRRHEDGALGALIEREDSAMLIVLTTMLTGIIVISGGIGLSSLFVLGR